MNGPADECQELRRRLALLDPLFRDLGAWIIAAYAKAGILDAMPNESFPVADAVFSRKTRGILRRRTWTYSPRGPVYVSTTRTGRLILYGQNPASSITEAVHEQAVLARPGEFPRAQGRQRPRDRPDEPVFLMDPATSDLYIRVTDPAAHPFPQQVRPFGSYARERAGLFIKAFNEAR
ncbi:hypothetical protein [Arthrobacter sp. USHLN218]|uniref:hypothetical protein n=1 Tax=Arthrobacter sp. USHLN218 TaxID=3081232 RepID=UPI003018064E